MKDSSIQWCDHTFNPWIGCSHAKTADGKPILECLLCYAETLDDNRFSKTLGGATKENPISHWGKGAPRHRTSAANWKQPLAWNKTPFWECPECAWRGSERQLDVETSGLAGGIFNGLRACPHCDTMEGHLLAARARVFCLSLGDWLDEEVPIEWLADLLEVIDKTRNLDWLLLTKRPQNFRDRLIQIRVILESAENYVAAKESEDADEQITQMWEFVDGWLEGREVPDNVWIGVSAGADQRAALDIPARVHFLSCEPMLKPLDTNYLPTQEFDLIIFGGESGKHARACYQEWIRAGVEFCNRNNIAPFVKQLGANSLTRATKESDWTPFKDSHGGDMSEWPEDLRVREFPKVSAIDCGSQSKP